MKRVLIDKELRLLRGRRGMATVLLSHAGESLLPGSEILVDDEVEAGYDHQQLRALPLVERPGLYILSRDVDPEYWMCAGRIIQHEAVH